MGAVYTRPRRSRYFFSQWPSVIDFTDVFTAWLVARVSRARGRVQKRVNLVNFPAGHKVHLTAGLKFQVASTSIVISLRLSMNF